MDDQLLQTLLEVPQRRVTEPLLAPTTKLFHAATNTELSELLGWKSSKLLTLLGRTKSNHYSVLYLRKKGGSGKLRTLHNPDGLMRAVQYRILTRILEQVEVPEYVYAFEKGKNIPAMAEAHVNKGVVISIDLKDFFGSIKQHHLLELFTNLGFGQAAAITLSELCTYKAFVPQGALTSPKLSNLITTFTFGPALREYCDQHGYTLTVYADDVTISCQEDIVKESGYDAAFEIVSFVSQLVNQWGFRVNRDKTKVMRPFQRQYVCGVVVNRKINLQKSERNKLRAIVHNVRMNGLAAEAAKTGASIEQFVNRTMGQLNWFGQLNPEAGVRLKSSFREVVQELSEPYAGDGSVKEIASLDISNTGADAAATAAV